MAYAEVFTALADPTRRDIFEALREQSKTVVELAAGLPVGRPALSQHLKVLKSARLVGAEPRGTVACIRSSATDWMICGGIWRVFGQISWPLMAPKYRDR